MKKILAVTVSLVIALSSANALAAWGDDAPVIASAGGDPQREYSINLKGLKSFSVKTYTVKQKFGEYYRTLSEKRTYKVEKDCFTECLVTDPADKVIEKSNWTYDKKGRQTSMEMANYAESSGYRTEYELFEDGREKCSVTYDGSGKMISKSFITYEDSREIYDSYNGEGVLDWKLISSRNAKGFIHNEYNGDGSLAARRVFNENDKGDVSSVEKYGSDEALIETEYYRYDEKGFLVEIQNQDPAGKIVYRTIYKNDSDGNPVRISGYKISDKFGTTVAELDCLFDFEYTR